MLRCQDDVVVSCGNIRFNVVRVRRARDGGMATDSWQGDGPSCRSCRTSSISARRTGQATRQRILRLIARDQGFRDDDEIERWRIRHPLHIHDFNALLRIMFSSLAEALLVFHLANRDGLRLSLRSFDIYTSSYMKR